MEDKKKKLALADVLASQFGGSMQLPTLVEGEEERRKRLEREAQTRALKTLAGG